MNQEYDFWCAREQKQAFRLARVSRNQHGGRVAAPLFAIAARSPVMAGQRASWHLVRARTLAHINEMPGHSLSEHSTTRNRLVCQPTCRSPCVRASSPARTYPGDAEQVSPSFLVLLLPACSASLRVVALLMLVDCIAGRFPTF